MRSTARGHEQGRQQRGTWGKENGPRQETGARMPPHGPELRAVRPVHRIRVAALEALHLLRLTRDMLAFVAPGTDEVRLVDHAPGLGAIRADRPKAWSV